MSQLELEKKEEVELTDRNVLFWKLVLTVTSEQLGEVFP